MTPHILLIGIDPDAVDYSAPGMPPGLDAARVRAELAAVTGAFANAGLAATLCPLDPTDSPDRHLRDAFAERAYAVVVIGGGLRVPPHTLTLLEEVVDAVRRLGPDARIAFNATPRDSVEAAQRALGRVMNAA